MTVDDIKWGLELMTNPPKGYQVNLPPFAIGVDRYDVVDSRTLRVVLKQPRASFFTFWGDARMGIVPRHVAEAEGLDIFKTKVVGSGPFKFKSRNLGTSYELTKNPDYYVTGRPYLDGIKWVNIPDRDTRFAALRLGQVHMSPGVSQGLSTPQTETIQAQLSKDLRVIRYPGGLGAGLIFNLTKSPVSDVRVRKAISLAVDRQEMISVVQQGAAHLSSDVTPEFWGTPVEDLLKLPGYRQPKEQDTAEAKRLLSEAGFPNGFTVKVVSWDRDPYFREPVILQQQLAKVGIVVEPFLKDSAVISELTRRGDFVIQNGVPLNMQTNDPDDLLSNYLPDGAGNDGKFSDPLVTELLEKQSYIVDIGERKRLIRQIEARLLDLSPRVIYYQLEYLRGVRNEVQGFYEGYGALRGMKFDQVWLSR